MRELHEDMLPLFKCVLESILSETLEVEWTVQGLGMMRCYIDEAKVWRLNIYHPTLEIPNVSQIHDHPWDLDSWILGGEFYNTRFYSHLDKPVYDIDDNTERFKWARILPGINSNVGGPGTAGGLKPDGQLWLTPRVEEVYTVGDHYHQDAEEIHMAGYHDLGAVTINRRDRGNRPDSARVFWPSDREWVSAKPRLATQKEIDEYTGIAMDLIKD